MSTEEKSQVMTLSKQQAKYLAYLKDLKLICENTNTFNMTSVIRKHRVSNEVLPAMEAMGIFNRSGKGRGVKYTYLGSEPNNMTAVKVYTITCNIQQKEIKATIAKKQAKEKATSDAKKREALKVTDDKEIQTATKDRTGEIMLKPAVSAEPKKPTVLSPNAKEIVRILRDEIQKSKRSTEHGLTGLDGNTTVLFDEIERAQHKNNTFNWMLLLVTVLSLTINIAVLAVILNMYGN